MTQVAQIKQLFKKPQLDFDLDPKFIDKFCGSVPLSDIQTEYSMQEQEFFVNEVGLFLKLKANLEWSNLIEPLKERFLVEFFESFTLNRISSLELVKALLQFCIQLGTFKLLPNLLNKSFNFEPKSREYLNLNGLFVKDASSNNLSTMFLLEYFGQIQGFEALSRELKKVETFEDFQIISAPVLKFKKYFKVEHLNKFSQNALKVLVKFSNNSDQVMATIQELEYFFKDDFYSIALFYLEFSKQFYSSDSLSKQCFGISLITRALKLDIEKSAVARWLDKNSFLQDFFNKAVVQAIKLSQSILVLLAEHGFFDLIFIEKLLELSLNSSEKKVCFDAVSTVGKFLPDRSSEKILNFGNKLTRHEWSEEFIDFLQTNSFSVKKWNQSPCLEICWKIFVHSDSKPLKLRSIEAIISCCKPLNLRKEACIKACEQIKVTLKVERAEFDHLVALLTRLIENDSSLATVCQKEFDLLSLLTKLVHGNISKASLMNILTLFELIMKQGYYLTNDESLELLQSTSISLNNFDLFVEFVFKSFKSSDPFRPFESSALVLKEILPKLQDHKRFTFCFLELNKKLKRIESFDDQPFKFKTVKEPFGIKFLWSLAKRDVEFIPSLALVYANLPNESSSKELLNKFVSKCIKNIQEPNVPKILLKFIQFIEFEKSSSSEDLTLNLIVDGQIIKIATRLNCSLDQVEKMLSLRFKKSVVELQGYPVNSDLDTLMMSNEQFIDAKKTKVTQARVLESFCLLSKEKRINSLVRKELFEFLRVNIESETNLQILLAIPADPLLVQEIEKNLNSLALPDSVHLKRLYLHTISRLANDKEKQKILFENENNLFLNLFSVDLMENTFTCCDFFRILSKYEHSSEDPDSADESSSAIESSSALDTLLNRFYVGLRHVALYVSPISLTMVKRALEFIKQLKKIPNQETIKVLLLESPSATIRELMLDFLVSEKSLDPFPLIANSVSLLPNNSLQYLKYLETIPTSDNLANLLALILEQNSKNKFDQRLAFSVISLIKATIEGNEEIESNTRNRICQLICNHVDLEISRDFLFKDLCLDNLVTVLTCVISNLQPFLESSNSNSASISLETESMGKLCGLVNQGSTCYMNSFLQQLFHTPYFRSLIEKSNSSKAATRELKNLFKALKQGQKKTVDTIEFIHALGQDNPIDVREQRDAQEFFIQLSDGIEEQETNLIDLAFGGKLKQEIKCEECNQVTTRIDKFTSLSIDISKSFQHGMSQLFKEERMEGTEKYFCKTCNKLVCAVRSNQVDSLPKNLIVHLKRFEFDLTTFQNLKLDKKFEFPLKFDLVNHSLAANTVYGLTGALVHQGNSQNGHYYSFIKERSSKNWFQFNDSKVIKFNPKTMLASECFGGQDMPTAYMLFYERKEDQSVEELDLPVQANAQVIPSTVNRLWKLSHDQNVVDFCEDLTRFTGADDDQQQRSLQGELAICMMILTNQLEPWISFIESARDLRIFKKYLKVLLCKPSFIKEPIQEHLFSQLKENSRSEFGLYLLENIDYNEDFLKLCGRFCIAGSSQKRLYLDKGAIIKLVEIFYKGTLARKYSLNLISLLLCHCSLTRRSERSEFYEIDSSFIDFLFDGEFLSLAFDYFEPLKNAIVHLCYNEKDLSIKFIETCICLINDPSACLLLENIGMIRDQLTEFRCQAILSNIDDAFGYPHLERLKSSLQRVSRAYL